MIRVLAKSFNSFAKFSTIRQLNYGQGGQCMINLQNKLYSIQFETIWEDKCYVEIHNDDYVSVTENDSSAIIHDEGIQPRLDRQVKITFKIPQDYSWQGLINGSIHHKKSNVSNKMRSMPSKIQILGANRQFQWGTWETQQLILSAPQTNVDIKSLTLENGHFSIQHFSSSKVLFSGQFDLKCSQNAKIRSVVAFGNALSKISAKNAEIQSISGAFQLEANRIKMDRIWGSPSGINIKANKIDKIGIQTGTGTIESQSPIDVSLISLGKLHKGKITQINEKKIIIQ